MAAALHFAGGEASVLLMRRRERATDRWSGQVALPGGRAEPADPDLVATAIRETREEVGVDLAASGTLLGQLDPVRAVARGKVLPMTITPFVFALAARPAIVVGDEAESCFWLPLARAAAGALDGVHAYRLGPLPVRLPCWRHEGYVVWGLTFQVLRGLIAVVGQPP